MHVSVLTIDTNKGIGLGTFGKCYPGLYQGEFRVVVKVNKTSDDSTIRSLLVCLDFLMLCAINIASYITVSDSFQMADNMHIPQFLKCSFREMSFSR